MSEQNNNEVKKEDGVEVDNVTFDANGELVGLDPEILDGVAGGLVESNGSGCVNGVAC